MEKSVSKMPKIAHRLRIAREMAGLSQGQVAKILGLKRPSVSEIEAGRRKVSAEELAKLSEIYAVDISWLIASEQEEDDENKIRLELAARELSKLKPEDVNRLLKLLSALRQGGNDK